MPLKNETLRGEWLQHPLTKELRQAIAEEIDGELTNLAEGSTLRNTASETNQETVRVLGILDGLKRVLSIIQEEWGVEENDGTGG